MQDGKELKVEVGQLWADNDPRIRSGDFKKRTLRIEELPHPRDSYQAARCLCLETQKVVKVRVDRLTKGSAYKLIKEGQAG